jgi:hypothetical protein
MIKQTNKRWWHLLLLLATLCCGKTFNATAPTEPWLFTTLFDDFLNPAPQEVSAPREVPAPLPLQPPVPNIVSEKHSTLPAIAAITGLGVSGALLVYALYAHYAQKPTPEKTTE